MFASVCEEAATLVLAGEHLVDFVDLNVSEVVFFRYTERAPVVVVLKNVSDGERGICKDAEEKCDEVYFGRGDVEVHHVYVWLILVKRSVYGGSEFIVYIP